MTAPFNRTRPTRATRDVGRTDAPCTVPRPAARLRAPLAALALAGAAATAAMTGGLPVLADASGDGTTVYRPGQAQTRPADAPAGRDDLAGSAETAPLRCEIALDAVHGGTEITGTVHSDRPVVGSYALAITSRSAGGSATIRQSGAFQAGPDSPATLGETRLMGGPASQDVDLSVTVDGERLTCGTAAL